MAAGVGFEAAVEVPEAGVSPVAELARDAVAGLLDDALLGDVADGTLDDEGVGVVGNGRGGGAVQAVEGAEALVPDSDHVAGLGLSA